jgi:hypothetical protein
MVILNLQKPQVPQLGDLGGYVFTGIGSSRGVCCKLRQ